MSDKSPQAGTPDALLAAKIRLLEDELAALKQQQAAAEVQAPTGRGKTAADEAVQQAPTPRARSSSSEGPLFDDHWVTDTLKFLVKQQHPKSIQQVLATLGKLLNLRELSLWLHDEQHHSANHLMQWAAADLDNGVRQQLCARAWLAPLLGANSPVLRQLQAGAPLIISATDHQQAALTVPLRALGIYNSLIIPLATQGHLRGFMSLQRDNPRTWHEQDSKALGSLLDWLFLFMQQHEQLRLMVDRDTRHQYAMEATNDGLWDWHLPSNKIYFSRSYLRMLGYDYEDLPGNLDTLRDYFVHPDDTDRIIGEYQSAIAERRESVQLQFRMLHRQGQVIWVHSKAKFFEPDHQGQCTRCVGINTDISDFISAREDLLGAKAEADLANKTKSEFLARVSHEIRTPMNAIIGIGYLLHDTQLDEQQQSYLTSINSAADSLLQIINQLLDFSKIEAGKVILEYAHFDLEQLFEKISRLFEISALHRTVNIVYDIKADVPRFLRGDASRLSQILSHLISNAFQYSKTDQVVVRVSKRQQNNKNIVLEFSIEDKGLGMSQEQLNQIKERLVFTKNAINLDKKTYGLSICSHLVDLMQGEFSLESQPGQGCTVSFSIELENSHLGEKTLLNQPRDLNSIRVLIVDDNTIARTIIASTARNIHLQVDESDNPLSALEAIRSADQAGTPYHFILLDYRMPSMNGLQLTGLIKSDRNLSLKPWIFLISAYHRDEISSADPNAILVDEFLSKPVSESRLFDAISQTIGRVQYLQQLSPEIHHHSESLTLLENSRILIAEDNIVNQQVLRGILKKKKINSVIAANGVEAIKLLENSAEPFDAILMDLEMPEMDGIEATRRIREGLVSGKPALHNIPIVAVTAQAMRGDRERCLAAGMDGYLSKPVNPELLYTTLADILRKHQVANGNLHH